MSLALYAGQARLPGHVQIVVYQPLWVVLRTRFEENFDVGALKVVRDDLGTEAGVGVLEVV